MAQSFVTEIGDRQGGEGVENTVGEHVKILSPKYYQRTDNGVVTNPSLQSALDGKAASDHTHDTAYLIQKTRESYYPSSTSWASIGSLCDGNATTTCTIKWPSDVITKNLTFSSSRGSVTFTKKGVYHIAVNIPLEVTAAAPDTYATTNFVFAYLAVYKTGSSDTAGYAYKRANVNRRLSELNTYFLDLDFDAVVNDDNAVMTGEVEFHGLNISGSDGCEITVHQPTASISRVADV